MAAANTKHAAFISDDSPAEFGNVESVIQAYFIGILAINVPKMDRFGPPFKVMHVFVTAVTFLQNESVL
jgi:hypothetical protein